MDVHFRHDGEELVSGPDLPGPVAELADVLARMPGVIAIVLGGSRALGRHDAASDWDLGVYYRGTIELGALAAYGAAVHPPGSWGRIMNGGAWLTHGGDRVDVILRNLDIVEHWAGRAEEGNFEVDALPGYVAGVPTYLLAAELASCRVLRGELPAGRPFPPKLASAAPPRWRFCRSFSLHYARLHAGRANVIGALVQAAKAVMEEAHAVLCERGEWMCNEKRLIDAAELSRVHALFRQPADRPDELLRFVDQIGRELGVSGEWWPQGPPEGGHYGDVLVGHR